MNTYFNKQPKPELKNSFLHDDGKKYFFYLLLIALFSVAILYYKIYSSKRS